MVAINLTRYLGGSSKIHTSYQMIQVLSKLRFTALERHIVYIKIGFFIYKWAGILLTSVHITQWVLATPTLTDTWFYEYH